MTNNPPTSIDLQSAIDAQDNIFVVIDQDYNIVAANRAYCKAYGASADDLIGQKCYEISHHSTKPCHLIGEDCPHKHVFETGKPHNVLHIHYDHHSREEHVRIKGSPLRDADGRLLLGEAVFPVVKSDEIGCDEQRMLGTSPAFLACIEEMSGAAPSDAPILLNGESGVGKDLAAKFIHSKSGRNAGPFIHIDCTAINEGLFECELFGYERGSFSGCLGSRSGLIESADEGTLFLDEVGEVPFSVQGRLLRALETGYFRRLGGREDHHVDIRVVCSTHNHLRNMVEQGIFRADLYYRIAGISITIPPLRERRADIPALVNAITEKLCDMQGTQCRVTDDAMQQLVEYDYPGNIRELKNILLKAGSRSGNGLITPELLQFEKLDNASTSPTRQQETAPRKPLRTNKSISEIEAAHIESLLHQYRGHRARVAEILRISERTLYRKLKQYNLQRVGKQGIL